MRLTQLNARLLVAACTLIAPMALGIIMPSAALALDVPAQVQTMANQLAKQGYKEFRFKNSGTAPTVLYGEQSGAAVEVHFDPATLDVIKFVAGFDENGDGQVSQMERHRVNLPDEASDVARYALQIANEVRVQAQEQARSDTANQAQTATQLAAKTQLASAAGQGNANANAGNASSNAGNAGSGNGSGNSGNGSGNSDGKGKRN